MSGQSFVVLGAGGHAKVVVATIQAAGGAIARLLDDVPERHGTRILGHLVEGPIGGGPRADGEVAVVAIGSNRARAAVAARWSGPFGVVVHPSAIVHASVTLGPGAVVFAGAVVQPGTTIGRHAIVNTRASVDHDCVLGDFVHVAPGVTLAGKVTLEEGAFMGVGSVAVPGVRVGAWATVGAGGVVVRDVPGGVTAVGVPARAIRRGGS